MQPERMAMPDYDDPILYLCPHCGQVIIIGKDELGGDEEVVGRCASVRVRHFTSPGVRR
jgi:hypothetical protein